MDNKYDKQYVYECLTVWFSVGVVCTYMTLKLKCVADVDLWFKV